MTQNLNNKVSLQLYPSLPLKLPLELAVSCPSRQLAFLDISKRHHWPIKINATTSDDAKRAAFTIMHFKNDMKNLPQTE